MPHADLPADQPPPPAPAAACSCWAALARVAHSAWFAYLTLAVFQLRALWGAWAYRDLTAGDTADYYAQAYGWATNLTVNILWSPLYTAFYGTVAWACPDIWQATPPTGPPSWSTSPGTPT